MQPRQQYRENQIDLAPLRHLLETQPRNALLLEMILETTATIPEILSLRMLDLKQLRIGESLPHRLRSGANSSPLFTAAMKYSFDALAKKDNLAATDYLFKSTKGNGQLSITSVSRLVRKWLEATGLDHYKGVRGLRSAQEVDGIAPGTNTARGEIQGAAYTLPKIENRTRQEVVFQELEQAIISGDIPPGQKLSTEKIAGEMGVSRIPVREAMGRLEARGFITTRPKWGSVVNELSRENFKEILDLRLLLECEAIAKAVPQVSDKTIEALEQINHRYAQARAENNADLLLKVNRKFHLMAYRDSNAPVLLELINQLWDRVSPYYNIMFRQSLAPHPTVGVNYHGQLIDAMGSRDTARAKQWIKEDLVKSAEFVLELFDLYQANN